MRPLALSTMVPWACVAALVWVSVLPGCSCSESEPGPDAAPSPQAGDPRPARPPAPTSAETPPPAPGAPVVSAELRSLLDATALSNADTFKDAMQRVAKLRDRALTRALVEALRSPDARVRAVAASGLRGIKDADSARGLRSFLAAHDPAELSRRVETGELSEAEGTMEVWTLRAAIATLGEIKDAEAVPYLEKALTTDGLRAVAAEALVKIRGADPELLAIPQSMGDALALGNALSKLADASQAPKLTKALSDPGVHRSVRLGAARALGRLKVEKAEAELARIARDSGENRVLRIGCAAAAGRIAGARQLELFRELLGRDADIIVRRGVARELGKLSIPGSLPLLVPLVDDGDERLRFRAADAVARISGEPFQVEDQGKSLVLRWPATSQVFAGGKTLRFSSSYAAVLRMDLSYRRRLGSN